MKIKRVNILWLFLATIIFSACRQNKSTLLPEISVTGKIMNAANIVVHLSELDVKSIKPIDSATLDEDGRFSFKIKPSGSMFLIISIKQGQQLILVADPGEKVHVEGDAGDLVKTAVITGSPESHLMLNFELFTIHNQQKSDSIGKVFLDSRSDPEFATIRKHLDSTYRAVVRDQRKYMEQFIDQHPNLLASLLVINRKFGPSAVFDESKDFHYFIKLDNGLMAAYPGNKHVLDHHSRVETLIAKQRQSVLRDSLLAPGMPAPEVRLKNTEGTIVALSSLKGKIVLVYFWAAMDAPSRKFIRQMIPIYQDFRKKGFEIYGLALEPNHTLWLNAAKLDKVGGIQVNAGSGLNASESIQFGVNKLPDALLIDRNGKILRRNINVLELRNELPGLLQK
jgi:hypothetical protein